jgi:hypothetical protein
MNFLAPYSLLDCILFGGLIGLLIAGFVWLGWHVFRTAGAISQIPYRGLIMGLLLLIVLSTTIIPMGYYTFRAVWDQTFAAKQ